MLCEAQLANDVRAKKADDIGADGELEPGVELFGDGCAAEHVPALEDEDLAPGLSEVGCAHEPVVPATNNDCVVVCHV